MTLLTTVSTVTPEKLARLLKIIANGEATIRPIIAQFAYSGNFSK